jgi:TatA/E family protein of Tat protein translocase
VARRRGSPIRLSEGDPSLDGCGAKAGGKSRDRTLFQIFVITEKEMQSGCFLDYSRAKSYIQGVLSRSIMFGNIGFPELLIILAVALLIFGPKKLPEVGKSIGRAVREFRRTSDEIKERIEEEIRVDEFKEIKDELKKDITEEIKDEEGPKVS